jgi:hypothetical protein
MKQQRKMAQAAQEATIQQKQAQEAHNRELEKIARERIDSGETKNANTASKPKFIPNMGIKQEDGTYQPVPVIQHGTEMLHGVTQQPIGPEVVPIPKPVAQGAAKLVEFTVEGQDKPIPGKIIGNQNVDMEGKPVHGVTAVNTIGQKKAPVNPWAKLDPIIVMQLGQPPQGDPNDPATAAKIADYGHKAETIKNRMASNPRLQGYAMLVGNRVVDVMDPDNPGVSHYKKVKDLTPDDIASRPTDTAGIRTKESRFNDISASLENLKKETDALDSGMESRAKIASVLADPQWTATTFLQSFPAGKLTNKEEAYVVANLNAREQIQGLRTLLGTGVGSEAQVQRILKTLPGASTPGSEYANRQIDAAMGNIKRLHEGVPSLKKTAVTYMDNGVRYQIPASEVAAFKKDHPKATLGGR